MVYLLGQAHKGGMSKFGQHTPPSTFQASRTGANLRNGSGQGFAKANMPLISVNPWAALAIAEGALMRHDCGAKCFERYRKDLNV
jgi:hypothetical protein